MLGTSVPFVSWSPQMLDSAILESLSTTSLCIIFCIGENLHDCLLICVTCRIYEKYKTRSLKLYVQTNQ